MKAYSKYLLCFLVIIYTITAFSTDDVFTKLIDVNQQLTTFELTYELCNPTSEILNMNTYLSSYNSSKTIYMTYNQAKEKINLIPIYTTKDVTINRLDNSSKTISKNITTKEFVRYDIDNPSTWHENKSIVLSKGECTKIKQLTIDKVRYGTIPIDIVPVFSYGGIYYAQKKWAWWNITYKFRIPITFHENSGTDLYNKQINFSFNSKKYVDANQMNKTLASIGITNSSSNELPFWIEDGTNNSLNTTIYVKVYKITASSTFTLYLYFDINASKKPKSNLSETFIGGDDFNTGTLNRVYWANASNPIVKVNGTELWLRNGGASSGIFHQITPFVKYNYLLITKMRNNASYFYESAVSNGSNFYNSEWAQGGFSNSLQFYASIHGTGNNTGTYIKNTHYYLDYILANYSASQGFRTWIITTNYSLNNRVHFATQGAGAYINYIMLGTYNGVAASAFVDWVIMLNYTGKPTLEPNASINSLETYTSDFNFIIINLPVNNTNQSDYTLTLKYNYTTTSLIKNCSYEFNVSATTYYNTTEIIPNGTHYENFTFSSTFNNQNIILNITCYSLGLAQNISNYSVFYLSIYIPNTSISWNYNIDSEFGEQPSNYYCQNETHLIAEWNIYLNSSHFTKTKTIYCENGCDINSNTCRGDETITNAFLMVLFCMAIIFVGTIAIRK